MPYRMLQKGADSLTLYQHIIKDLRDSINEMLGIKFCMQSTGNQPYMEKGTLNICQSHSDGNKLIS